MKNNICAKIRSYILYLLLITIRYRAFGFTLDTNKSMFWPLHAKF